MSNFIWVRNPTVQNGLTTTYVSKRGSDTTGDGTAQNPYASIAYATSVAATKTNIMLDDGEWTEARTANNRIFYWYGNGRTKIDITGRFWYWYESFNFLIYCAKEQTAHFDGTNVQRLYINNCILYDFAFAATGVNYITINNSIILKGVSTYHTGGLGGSEINHCVYINSIARTAYMYFYNSIVLNTTDGNPYFENCNFGSYSIPSNSKNCVNNTITEQTISDYFNFVSNAVLTNPETATIDECLQCDFTAKVGSYNIGKGQKGSTIGLNQGFAARADGTASDVFSAANGATLRNVEFSSSLNGYVLQQVNKVCAGATSNTITLASDASSVNDYYNGLFIGIVEGTGETQIRYITDYDGATKTATVSTNWATIPDTESEYTISGKIDSAVKDFGEAIKVKRNFTFIDNMTALPNGEWEQFLTAKNSQNEMNPCSCYSYEYSVDNTTWRSGSELISATDGTNYVESFNIGDASDTFDETESEFITLRYILFHIHIGFNIDVLAEE